MSIFKKKLLITSMILASSTLAHGAPFGLEARSLGMGNVSVASADIATAALSNPAMLSYQKASEDFSLLVSGGLFIDDSDGMIDSVEAFQFAADQLNLSQQVVATTVTEVNNQITDVNNMTASGNALAGKVLSPNVSVAAVIGFSFEEYSLAFSVRSDEAFAIGLIGPVNFGAPVALLAGGATPTAITQAETDVAGVEATATAVGNNRLQITDANIVEIGLSGAKSFDIGGHKISVGLTPKIVSAEVSSSTPTNILNFSTAGSDLTSSTNAPISLGEVFTVDVGVVAEISENTQVGIVIKNLIEDSLSNGVETVNIARSMKVGVAYTGDLFTAGIDLDLIEADPVVTSTTAVNAKPTKMLNVGMEFNAWDVAQVRIGFQKNIASGISAASKDPQITAGVGIWVGVNIDVAVIATEDSVGGFVQTGFKF